MSGRKPSEHKSERSTDAAGSLTIACSESGCESTALLSLERANSPRGGSVSEAGWAILNSPEDNSFLFLCPSCFKENLESDSLEFEEIEEEDEDDAEEEP